jgi:D-3-phosphoglycerate dehydrogenase
MRLLVADIVDPLPLEELRLLNVEVVHDPSLTRETLADALAGGSGSGADGGREASPVGILVVRDTDVTAQAIERASALNLVVRLGGGSAVVDVAAASARGIYVAHCPGQSAASVAELVFGLMVGLDRRIYEASADLRAGRWEHDRYAGESGLVGKRIGIVGLGAVGREVLVRARAFGLKPFAWSRSLTAARASKLEVGFAPSLERLAAQSDVLSVHLPLTPQTRGIVSRTVLEALPQGAIVLNTARAELVDVDALVELAPRKELRVGFDVFPSQPSEGSASFTAPLAGLPLAVCTPHLGSATRQAQRTLAEEVVHVVRSFLTEEDVPNVVNVCAASPARYVVVLRQLDKVGALANTLAVLKRHGINIEEISNTVFDGARAVCTKLRVSGRPSESCLREIAAFEETLHVDLIPMPNRA